MAIRVRRLNASKIESSAHSVGKQPGVATGVSEDDIQVAVIVKVRKPNHIPQGMTVRSRISELVFTANTTLAALAKAEQDPLVVSIGAPRPIFADKKSAPQTDACS